VGPRGFCASWPRRRGGPALVQTGRGAAACSCEQCLNWM
jgi:hypothetical protein